MTNCDACVNYEYDEDYECYCCMVNLECTAFYPEPSRNVPTFDWMTNMRW